MVREDLLPDNLRGRARKNGHVPGIFTAAELLAEEMSPVSWVVPDIVPEGVTVLAGKPKLGKSWMVLDIGIDIATGGVALGTKRVERGEVLYLALEDNKRRLKERISKLLAAGSVPEGLHIAVEWPRADEGGVEELVAFLEEHRDCRLVVVGTLARFKPRANGRPTQYDEERDAVDPLVTIAAEHSIAIVLVHHLREAESDDPLDMIHGSAGLTGGVDGALVLKRRRGKADAFLHVEGRDIRNSTELGLRFDRDSAKWTIIGEADEYRMSEGREAISGLLKDADEPMGPKEITTVLQAKGMDVQYGAVREMLSQMVKDGQVKNLGRGRYVHPDNALSSADKPDKLT